jgi:hypothetical protein
MTRLTSHDKKIKSSKRAVRTLARLALVCALVTGLSSCSAEKAKALQALAMQFKVEAHAALDLIEQVRVRELEPPPRPKVEATRDFALALLEGPAVLTPTMLDDAAEPFAIERQRTEWDDKAESLRGQYSLFADMFEDLAAGSYVAKDAVARSKDIVRDLTLQLVAFANAIERNPPIFVQRRAALIAEIDRIRADTSLDDRQKLEAIGPYLERWETVQREERELGAAVIAQCAKAAMLGKDVRTLAENYARLDIDAIHSIVVDALDTAGTITGRDVTDARGKVAQTISTIKADPIWSGLVDRALNDVSAAASARASTEAMAAAVGGDTP